MRGSDAEFECDSQVHTGNKFARIALHDAPFPMSGRSNLKFIRVGLPFFSIVFGGAFGLHYFQQVRYDFRKIRKIDENLDHLRSDLKQSGVKVKKDVSIDSVYKEVVELDTDSWQNIRGPREFEDLTEYERIKKEQKESNASVRRQKASNPDEKNLL